MNIIPFEVNKNFCSFMKWWHFIGLLIALEKKNYYGFVAGGLKSCVEERQLLLCQNEWTFYVTVLNRQWINDYLTQTPRFANCEGWGAKISGKDAEASALWELGSTEVDVQRVYFKLTWNTVSLAEGDPIFLHCINEAIEIFCATSPTKHHTEDVAHKEWSKSGFKPSL